MARVPLIGLFNFVGLGLFSGAEIWASLSERSANLQPTPADNAVLSLQGFSSAPISPTVVVVAFLLPFASLYYGFSQQHHQRRATEEEQAEQERAEDFALRRKLARAEAAARLRAVQVGGLAAAVRAGMQAVHTPAPDLDAARPAYADVADVGHRADVLSADADDDAEHLRPLGLARRA